MGIRVFDYECQSGHVHEAFTKCLLDVVPCPLCGKPAMRKIPAPRSKLEGFSGDFPSAADKWEKRRESHMAKERRHMERHGTYDTTK